MGRLELIIGPMFSGKSSLLLSRIRKHRVLMRNVLILTHESDIRYGTNKIISHDLATVEAHPVGSLIGIQEAGHPLHALYTACQSIFIEEAQWFSDIEAFVDAAVNTAGKFVCVCGLDGDFNMQPFHNIVNMIPCAEDVTKCRALCKACNDGTEAAFTKCWVKPDGRKHVGGAESYAAVCRKHFFVR